MLDSLPPTHIGIKAINPPPPRQNSSSQCMAVQKFAESETPFNLILQQLSTRFRVANILINLEPKLLMQ